MYTGEIKDPGGDVIPNVGPKPLPRAPIAQLAVLRVDGDLYQSVMETMEYMYPKVSVGGYIILDDYGEHLPPAKRAVDDYRKAHGITTPIERIDYSGAFWRKENPTL